MVKLQMIRSSASGAFIGLPFSALFGSKDAVCDAERSFSGISPASMGTKISVAFGGQGSGSPKWGGASETFNPTSFVSEIPSRACAGTCDGLSFSDLNLGWWSLEDRTALRAGKLNQGKAPRLYCKHNTVRSEVQYEIVGVVKSDLIDLETRKRVTGRKQAKAVQRERLSDRTRKGCDSLNSAITAEKAERRIRRSSPAYQTKIGHQSNRLNNQTYIWYSGYQTLNIAPSQVFTAAEFPIRQSAVAVSISGLEELQNS
jgi:hypothetical protein